MMTRLVQSQSRTIMSRVNAYQVSRQPHTATTRLVRALLCHWSWLADCAHVVSCAYWVDGLQGEAEAKAMEVSSAFSSASQAMAKALTGLAQQADQAQQELHDLTAQLR